MAIDKNVQKLLINWADGFLVDAIVNFLQAGGTEEEIKSILGIDATEVFEDLLVAAKERIYFEDTVCKDSAGKLIYEK